MDIKALRYFLQVAETLSFNRASERLNISQPVVTRVIAQLEHEIGTRLFDRTTRRVSLTPAGTVLLNEVRPLIAHVESVQQTVRHVVAEQSGKFTVGYTTLAMQTVTPDLLRLFSEKYPEIELDVREMTTHAQVEALLSAEIDVGFVLTPVEDEALTVIPLHKERLRLRYPAVTRKPLWQEKINRFRWLLLQMRSLLSPAKSSSLPFMMKLSGFVRRQDFVPACVHVEKTRRVSDWHELVLA